MPLAFMSTTDGGRGARAGGALGGIGIHGLARSLSFPETEFSTAHLVGDSIRPGGSIKLLCTDTVMVMELTGMAGPVLACTTISDLIRTIGGPAHIMPKAAIMHTVSTTVPGQPEADSTQDQG